MEIWKLGQLVRCCEGLYDILHHLRFATGFKGFDEE